MLSFLKADYPLQKQLYLVSRYLLSSLGYEPQSTKSKYLHAWALINYMVLIFFNCAGLGFVLANFRVDLEKTMDALCVESTSIMALIKLFFLWWHRADLAYLVKRVSAMASEQEGVTNTAIKRKIFLLATQLSAALCAFTFVTTIVYLVRPLLVNLLRYVQGDALLWEIPFYLSLPASMLEMPYYPFTYMSMFWYSFVCVYGYLGTDAFFVGNCFYLAALLKCLQTDLMELKAVQLSKVAANEKYVMSADDEAEIYEKLSNIIARHNEIADLVELFSKAMVVSTLGYFITANASIGLTIVVLTQRSGVNTIIYIFFASSVITELFLHCVSGTLITETSRGVAFAAYSFPWYLYSVRVQKMVLLLILRSQRSLVVEVPFFAPSLPVFTQIMKFTGSLITLANSMF